MIDDNRADGSLRPPLVESVKCAQDRIACPTAFEYLGRACETCVADIGGGSTARVAVSVCEEAA